MLRATGMQTSWTRTLKGWTGQWLPPLALGASAFLMTGVRPTADIIPFAWALLAAGLLAGVHPLPILAGCLAGCITPDGLRWPAVMGTAGVMAAAMSVRAAQNAGGFLQQRLRPETAASAIAGAGVLAAGLPAAAGAPWQSLTVATAAVAAAAAAPFAMAWLRTGTGRRHLMPEERAGLGILLCAVLAGAAVRQQTLAVTAAFAGTLAAAGLGPGAGACAGLITGGVLTAMGGPPGRMAAMGMCGAAAGLAPQKKNWAQPLAFAAAAGLAVLLTDSPPQDLLCAMTACAVIPMLPESRLKQLRGWLAGEKTACDPDRLAGRLRADTARRLRALSDAFGELAEGYKLPVNVPDEQSLIADMRDSLCENCARYEQCWAGGDNRAVRFLCQLISEAIDWAGSDGASPLFKDEITPELQRACRRGKSVPARLGPLLEDFARNRRTEMKRKCVNQLISAQFRQAQLLLCGMAESQERPMRVRGRQAARARAALDRAGIETEDVMALRGVHSMEIAAALHRGRWSPGQAERAAAHLSRTFGRTYAPAEGIGYREMKFIRLPRLRASASACCHSGVPGIPSGDSHIIRMLEGDRLLLILSDGMGSGEAAARESAQTLRLLWQFLAADVSRELALDTVNELMLARSGEDMFATVDLCVIDLSDGTAEFTKLAACRSLILRGDEVLEVAGGRLPLGILEQVQPSVCRVSLQPGDVILMGSDGVMDAADSSALCDCLLAHGRNSPDRLAEIIVSAVERLAPKHRDDMTAIVARVA